MNPVRVTFTAGCYDSTFNSGEVQLRQPPSYLKRLLTSILWVEAITACSEWLYAWSARGKIKSMNQARVSVVGC
jgi:hypothetical protein